MQQNVPLVRLLLRFFLSVMILMSFMCPEQIVARSSPTEAFPQDLIDKLSKYPHAFIGGWMPQQTVLEHPVRTAFLSHLVPILTPLVCHRPQAGVLPTVDITPYSSVYTQACPCKPFTPHLLPYALPCSPSLDRIVWPIAVDQATNAVHLTYNLNIAYELPQVRHGHGLGPIRRMPGKKLLGTVDAVRDELRDVLVQAFGADGAAKRARLEILQETLHGAWGEKGIARAETEAFLDSVSALHPSTFADAQVAAPQA